MRHEPGNAQPGVLGFAEEKSRAATALVVEDDPEQLVLLCVTLGAHYPVLSASCGKDALHIARDAQPTVIVLDLMLPGGMDGLTVFGSLRGDPATRRIPVILLSSVNRSLGLAFDAATVGRYLGGEPAAFLDKPVSPERLLAEVRKALGERWRRVASGAIRGSRDAHEKGSATWSTGWRSGAGTWAGKESAR